MDAEVCALGSSTTAQTTQWHLRWYGRLERHLMARSLSMHKERAVAQRSD